MRKLQFLGVLVMLLCCLPVSGQKNLKFSIASFEHDPFDLTAKNDAYKKIDGSGALYAIIKVTSNNPDDNLNEHTFSNRANAKLYVPAGCKSVYEAADQWKVFKKIREHSPNISFADANVKAFCVANWDTNEEN